MFKLSVCFSYSANVVTQQNITNKVSHLPLNTASYWWSCCCCQ